MKRIMRFLSVLVIICSVMIQMPFKAKAQYTWIEDREKVDGYDFTASYKLASKLNSIFDGNASVYSDNKCTNLVNTRIGSCSVPNNKVTQYVGPYGGPAINSGTSCWIYANGVYYTLFGECTGSGTAGKNSEKLNLNSTTNKKATYDNFKKWGVRPGVGALIRTNSPNSHSMIVMGYNEDTLTILDGNGRGNHATKSGIISLRVRSWDEISFTVSYIIQPKETYYNALYPVCNHKNADGSSAYQGCGICSICGQPFDWQSTFNAADAGTYKLLSSNSTPKTEPYQDSKNATFCLNPSSIEVIGSYQNAYGNKWYATEVSGKEYYFYSGHMELIGRAELSVSCTNFSPANNAVLEKKSYPVKGTVTSNYPLKTIEAYLDGSLIATWTGDQRTKTVELRNTAVNSNLKFGNLSTGKHTITLRAYDYVHSSWVQFHRSIFYIEQAACSHSYSSSITTAATCVAPGVRTFTCSKCGDCYTQAIPATGIHSYGNWVTITPATCTAAGSQQRNCVMCGAAQTQSIAATGHSYANYITPPTCTNGGYTTHSCFCGYSYVDAYTSAVGHSYADNVTKEPTCTEQGYTVHTCHCGYSYKDGYTEAYGHMYVNGFCIRCRVADPNYVPGDMNADGIVSNQDVELFLWYTLFPDSYEVFCNTDLNGDGYVNNQDVEYLLWYTLFPQDYPLS